MRFFSLPHILWHWASVYNGHIRWLVALTPVAERFKLSLPIFTIGLSGLDANTQPFACEVYALTNWATAAVRLLICVVICYIMARSKVFDHGSSAKVIDERVSIKENSRNCPMTTRQWPWHDIFASQGFLIRTASQNNPRPSELSKSRVCLRHVMSQLLSYVKDDNENYIAFFLLKCIT